MILSSISDRKCRVETSKAFRLRTGDYLWTLNGDNHANIVEWFRYDSHLVDVGRKRKLEEFILRRCQSQLTFIFQPIRSILDGLLNSQLRLSMSNWRHLISLSLSLKKMWFLKSIQVEDVNSWTGGNSPHIEAILHGHGYRKSEIDSTWCRYIHDEATAPLAVTVCR